MHKENNTSQRFLLFTLLIIAVLFMAGCTTKPGGIRHIADEQLKQKNPIKHIALFAESQVWWSIFSKDEPVLGLKSSKLAAKILLPALHKVLETKGYKVIFAEVTGVGYPSKKRKKNYIYKDYIAKGDDSFYQGVKGKTVYEYNILNKKPKAKLAARRIFTELEANVSDKKWKPFEPRIEDIRQLQKLSGGDTLCFARIGGRRYTDTRRTVDTVMSILEIIAIFAGQGGGGGRISQHSWSLYLACVDASNAKLIWQHGRQTFGDPIAPDVSLLPTMLEYFPPAKKPLAPGCKNSKKKAELFFCSPSADDGLWTGIMKCDVNTRGDQPWQYKTRIRIKNNTTTSYQFDLTGLNAEDLKWLHEIYEKSYFRDKYTLEFPISLEMDHRGKTIIKGDYKVSARFFDIYLKGQFKNKTFNLDGIRGTRDCQLKLKQQDKRKI